MKNKLISVIVVCYNSEYDKLIKTINSIINQKNVNYEIIIADDGSRVQYKEELLKYFHSVKFDKVKYCFSEKNVGTVKNILSALYLSSGKYVKTISPGDYLYDEHALENYLEVFTEKDADVVFGRAQYFSPSGELLKGAAPANNLVYRNHGIKKSILLYGDFILGASIASKTDVEIYYLEKVKDKIKYLEDIPLTVFGLLDGIKIKATNKKLIWYEHGEGISTDKNRSPLLEPDYQALYKEMLLENPKIAKKHIKFSKAFKISNPFIRFVKKVTVSPSYLFYKIASVVIGKKQKTDDIQKMYEIIK